MKKLKNELIGFFLFFITLFVVVSISLIVYSLLKDTSLLIVIIVVILLIAVFSFIFIIIDTLRRKHDFDKPVKEIRNATKRMTNGDFDIELLTNNNLPDYTMYDLIKNDLNILAKELSKNEVLKNDFISNFSHEVKTPISVIQNYAKALENEKLDNETRKKYLTYLQESCKKLSVLITNILKLNKLENQELLPEYKRFNLSNSITNQILQYENLIEEKNIELDCSIEEDIFVESEENYLEIIWNNLISNAIKFTEKDGKITINLNKINEIVTFTITDTGCGIDGQTGKHIFDKFYQGDTSHSKEGNGLGLALVKKVIDRLGGEISINSEVGVGTTFVVKIKEK